MNLPKTLLSAILLGITLQTTGCIHDEAPQPDPEEQAENGEDPYKYNCPGCGMG